MPQTHHRHCLVGGIEVYVRNTLQRYRMAVTNRVERFCLVLAEREERRRTRRGLLALQGLLKVSKGL
jgi:hypothetical protein